MSVEVKNLDHLGLVAGIIDEIGIVEIVNELLGENKTEKVSAGLVVKAMILNGMGLVSSPLYLFKNFFETQAVEHLLGEDIKAEYLNDDRLGRLLDKIYRFGLNRIFVAIGLAAVKKYQLTVNSTHLDSSSFHVHGDYPNSGEPGTIEITYGYSRDHRPDLKQFLMNLICTGDGDVPLWMKMGSGNDSDSKQFGRAMLEFKEQFQLESLTVADSAFYTQENLQIAKEVKWLSRVPLTLKAAKNLVESVEEDDLKPSQSSGYRFQELRQNYAAIEQRWLLVESQKRKESDLKTLEKKIQKDGETAQKKLRELSTREFACAADAQKAASRLLRKSKYHQLTDLEITENSGVYQVKAIVTIDAVSVEIKKRSAGRFIWATNVLNPEELTAESMLSNSKEQQSVERGFGFLKDPLFLTDSVFLNSPHRIEALGFIMGLCLLVYTLGQRQLRQTLKRLKTGVKNQLGRLTDRPTLRWIFQCFQGIHVFRTQGVKQISNLTSERLRLLEFFPKSGQAYYLLT